MRVTGSMHARNAAAAAAAYWGALKALPQIVMRLPLRKRSLQQELQEAMLRGSLQKMFGPWDTLFLGVGIVIGSGWAQLLGSAAKSYSGPGVVVSVLISGVAALLTSVCYGELAVEYPLSGAAFSYTMVTFGDFPAFICLASLLLEYAIGNAVVARGFSTYLARLLNLPPGYFRVGDKGPCGKAQGGTFDIMAAGITLLVSVVLALGGRENAMLISGVTLFKLMLLVLIAIVGFTQANGAQMAPFTQPQFGFDGLWIGAALLFFIYTGFGALGAAAEEVTEVRHIPYALVGTSVIAGLLYLLLSLALSLMTCPNAGCPDSQWLSSLGNLNFVTAFSGSGMVWMQYIVAVAALCGVVTSLVVGMFSISRIVMSASRDAMLPPFLARVSRRTQTPVFALMVLGVIIAVLGLLVENSAAATMASFGALVSLWLVCNIQLYRRYWPDDQIRVTRHGTVVATPSAHKSQAAKAGEALSGAQHLQRWLPANRWQLSLRTRKLLLWGHLILINGICIALAIYYQLTALYNVEGEACLTPSTAAGAPPPPVCHPGGCPAFANSFRRQNRPEIWCIVGAWGLATLSLQLWCPLEYTPQGWHVPACLMPWLPSVAINLVVFSVGALPTEDYREVGYYFAAAILFYLLVSLPLSYIKQSASDWVNAEELRVVELQFIDGAWRPVLPHHGLSAAHSLGTSLGPSAHGVPSSGSAISLGPTVNYSAASLAAAMARTSSGSLAAHLTHSRAMLGGPTSPSRPLSAGSLPAGQPSQLSPRSMPSGGGPSGLPGNSSRGSSPRLSGGALLGSGSSSGGGSGGGPRGTDSAMRSLAALPSVPEHKGAAPH